MSISSGMRAGDLERLKVILDLVPEIEYICLDVANGYSEHFVEFVKQVRKEFPRHTIMVYKFCYRLFITMCPSLVRGENDWMERSIKWIKCKWSNFYNTRNFVL